MAPGHWRAGRLREPGGEADAQLDKGARFTDWARRPLDKPARFCGATSPTWPSSSHACASGWAGPAPHLGRRGDERLADPANIDRSGEGLEAPQDPAPAAPTPRPPMALAAWRETRRAARSAARPVMKDERPLADVALHPPQSRRRWAPCAAPPVFFFGARRDGGAPPQADPLPASELPPREERGPSLGREGALVADLLKLLLRNRAPRIQCRAAAHSQGRGTGAARSRAARGAGDTSKAGGSIFRDALDLVRGPARLRGAQRQAGERTRIELEVQIVEKTALLALGLGRLRDDRARIARPPGPCSTERLSPLP